MYLVQACPYTKKYELVDWANKRWPNTPVSKFRAMKRKQLYALWYSEEKKARYKRMPKNDEVLLTGAEYRKVLYRNIVLQLTNYIRKYNDSN